MRRQEGAGGALIAVILALVALLILAIVSMTRTRGGSEEREQTIAKLTSSAAALEGYVGSNFRLPCPADPTADTGLAVPNPPAGCQFPEGTIPWSTIGMRREDSFDAWGRKISYRVYTGNAGSLTQDGGASMANCDAHEAFPGGTTPTGGGSGGLCKPVPNTPNPADRTTTAKEFVAGKGLTVTDSGTVHNDVAYVLISHGITGLGGYTASAVRLDMPPNGAERNNTKDTGPFTIRAFSDPDTGATAVTHFDDLLLYRGIEDLAKRANLAPRPWKDAILSAVVFDRATVRDALGGSNPGSDTGQATIGFNNATVGAFDTSGNQNISFVSGGGGVDAIGGVSGGDGLLGSAGGEGLRIDFDEDARQFAFTVDQFEDFAALHERVELRFFTVAGSTATLKGTVVKQSCAANGKVASFTIDACASFNRVEIRPVTMSDNVSPSSFSLAEIRTCIAGVTCETSLQPAGNVCSTKTFTPCSIGLNNPSQLTITLANNDSTAKSGVDFTDNYPAGLVNIAAATAATTCSGGVVTAAGGGSSIALTGATVPAAGSCKVTVDVTSAALGTYTNSTGNVTTVSSGTISAASGTLVALAHPVAAMAFSPNTVGTTLPSLLTITFTNPNTQPITGLAVGGPLPAGLTLHLPVTLGNTCGGTLTNSGDTITFADGTIPEAVGGLPGSCTISTRVTSLSAGTYTVLFPPGTVTSGNAGANTTAASASLDVN